MAIARGTPANGRLFTHPLSAQGTDLKDSLPEGASHEDLQQIISDTWTNRQDRYSELRSSLGDHSRLRVEMSAIGG